MVWKEDQEVAYGGILMKNEAGDCFVCTSVELGNLPKPRIENTSEREKG